MEHRGDSWLSYRMSYQVNYVGEGEEADKGEELT